MENSGNNLKIRKTTVEENRPYAKITTPFHKYNRYRKYNENDRMESHLMNAQTQKRSEYLA